MTGPTSEQLAEAIFAAGLSATAANVAVAAVTVLLPESTGPFRTGRKVGRTVYRGDELIGVMDTPGLGYLVVRALNAMSDPSALGPRCPYVVTSDDGTSYCRLDEASTRP